MGVAVIKGANPPYDPSERPPHSSHRGAAMSIQKPTNNRGENERRREEESEADSPSHLIDAKIGALGDWRGEMLARVRALIQEADPDVVEEVKWRKPSNPLGVPVWSHDGIICTGETYKDKVKLTFAKGASLDDPAGLFNASLEGNTRRAIDIHEGDAIDEKAFKALIRAAVALNTAKGRAPAIIISNSSCAGLTRASIKKTEITSK